MCFLFLFFSFYTSGAQQTLATNIISIILSGKEEREGVDGLKYELEYGALASRIINKMEAVLQPIYGGYVASLTFGDGNCATQITV